MAERESVSGGTDAERLQASFAGLTTDERQLLTCALAGNHPPRLAPLRMAVLRGLARADRQDRIARERERRRRANVPGPGNRK